MYTEDERADDMFLEWRERLQRNTTEDGTVRAYLQCLCLQTRTGTGEWWTI